MPARFEPFLEYHGLDKRASPDWLMVPMTGINLVYLAGADGMTVTPVNPYLIEVKDVPIGRLRLLEIKGRMPGTTYLDVRDSRGLAARLEVCVKIRRYVYVMFHYVEDSTGRKTQRKLGDEVALIDQANKILIPQANVEIVKYGAKPHKVSSDLGPVVGAYEKKSPSHSGFHKEWNAVVTGADTNADLNVFFVWELEGERDTTPFEDNTQAATKDSFGYTLFEDEVPNEGQALAHEFGHALGLDDRRDERDRKFLMYHAINTATGCRLSKYDVHTVNP